MIKVGLHPLSALAGQLFASPPPFHLSLLPPTPSVVFPPHRGLSKVGRFLYVPLLSFLMKSMSVSLYQIIKSPLKSECLTSCYQLDPQVSVNVFLLRRMIVVVVGGVLKAQHTKIQSGLNHVPNILDPKDSSHFSSPSGLS